MMLNHVSLIIRMILLNYKKHQAACIGVIFPLCGEFDSNDV